MNSCAVTFPDGVDFHPIVRVIDSYLTNRNLGMLFEANVQAGKLFVCSADIIDDLDNRIIARQLRYAILSYMNSDDFHPLYTADSNFLDVFSINPLIKRQIS